MPTAIRSHTDLPGRHPANRLALDYRGEASRLGDRGPIVDVHTHLGGVEPTRRFFDAADLYGVERVWSMTQLEDIDAMRDAFGERVRFIAVPNYGARDRPDTFTTDWLRRLEGFARKGVRIAKFWAAPRGLDFAGERGGLGWIDAEDRRESMDLARSLGMAFMTHVADPDTWFATRYADASRYGSKRSHHDALRRAMDRYGEVLWIAAHLAGSPEDLDAVQRLLDDYPRLHLDCSATKWMVREVSRHPDEFADFVRRNRGRVMFGSDSVASIENMIDRPELAVPSEDGRPGVGGGGGFDLFASRYWALRTLIETRYDGPSPIVDPDLPMIDPATPDPRHRSPHRGGARRRRPRLALPPHRGARARPAVYLSHADAEESSNIYAD